ncbi:MAG: MucR family transcriptional regulator [Alphaproteobacteria bacterium]|nr:MucR family transcriptional regulator [Alphaproteobacteria bacterium]
MHRTELLQLTTDIVVSHVANNRLAVEELPKLIHDVYASLIGAGPKGKPERKRPQPAVPIRKSVTPNYIVCLEDGKKLKMLKRHLKTAYGMTPEEYRARWRLPPDYPMVAPAYAEQRSKLAKKIGLGSRSRKRKK